MLAVSGCVSTGNDYAQTNELFSSMDVPFMAPDTFQKHHQTVFQSIEESSWGTMIEVAREEARLAVEYGDVNENGIPIIAITGDGAYSINYDASSGVASIIGINTKKKLFAGVRNKYCNFEMMTL